MKDQRDARVVRLLDTAMAAAFALGLFWISHSLTIAVAGACVLSTGLWVTTWFLGKHPAQDNDAALLAEDAVA